MNTKNDYQSFQERVFREISDLEAEYEKHPIANTLGEYGLTLQEATRLYYRPGMTGKQFIQAVIADRNK